MTNKEIVKALKCCIKNECTNCPINKMFCSDKVAIRHALELINRQQAQIEQLKKENKILFKNADTAFQDGLNEAQDLYAKQVENEIRDRSVKEFAERLKLVYKLDKRYDRPNPHTMLTMLFSNIDKLVEQMTGAK